MLQVVAQTRIFLAVKAVDFRKGIDGLASVCRQCLQNDPFSGALFVFRNRRGNAIKILVFDGQGFWMCLKRFSQGKLQWWPNTPGASLKLTASQLQILLWNGNPVGASIPEDWRRIES
jgi:transposase